MAVTSRPASDGGGGGWLLATPDEPTEAAVVAARLATVDGCVGTRAVTESAEGGAAGTTTRVSGIYGPEPPGTLLTAPAWFPALPTGLGVDWVLDLGTGVLDHRLVVDGDLRTTSRWAIAAEPGCQVHVTAAGDAPPDPSPTVLAGASGRRAGLAVCSTICGGERMTVLATSTSGSSGYAITAARRRAERISGLGVGTLRRRQAQRWAARWSTVSATIDGDVGDDLRTRFALFHLHALADHDEELALGARGLTGPGYGGHVFWDADVFVLPALVTVAPSAARAMISYRLRRLGAARRFAAESGASGARYPWESAASGTDVTPRWATGLGSAPIAIRTGDQEQHITADVAWAIETYRRWTGDDAVLDQGGASLTIGAARYLASLVRVDEYGAGHIDGVIGPDEYHESVTDNAFTNQMVRWTLRSALSLLEQGWHELASPEERTCWQSLADRLVDGYDPTTGTTLQFAGYDELDLVRAEALAEPPFAGDLLLGSEGVGRSQLIKQADVVMLHNLIPEEQPDGSLERDLTYYLERTCHGSSLSPAIHAAVLARAGRPDEALRWYRIALAIDLDDLTGTGAGGLHYATLGGVWQALLGGFLGLRATGCELIVDPALPSQWNRVEIRCRYRGTSLWVAATHDRVDVACGAPVVFRAGEGGDSHGPQTALTLARTPRGWVTT